ncbi:MAG: sigma 54-interacting transcriptional regulator [Desulfarculus sp.]|nr:sigma 54-interacting transcriptional regulator [Desulfarculus sp.]
MPDLEKPPLPWATVLDASHNGIMVVDRRGVILLFNQAARRVLGDIQGSPVGRHFSQVRPETWPEIQEVLTTGRPQIGRRISLPQATIIANRNPILVEGRVEGVISVFQDISEYEAIISQLQGFRRLNRQLEAIFETSQDGLYIADGQAIGIRTNNAYERITGLRREDLLGKSLQQLVDEGYIDQSVTLEVLKKGSQVTIMQQIRGDKQVMVTGTPVFDDDGAIALVVTNVRDLTGLNELRAQLEESRRLSSRYYESLLEHEGFEHALQDMVVRSEAVAQVVRRAVKVARVSASVIIYGESGVGKSMLARVIHHLSPRKDRPFVKINCGTIPASLMESELFGYAKGAFTGAAAEGKAGLVEMGHTGTVFLDEVGELTPAMQVKLLEVIEDKTFTRVGATRPTVVDVRIIAATNRDLKAMVGQGQFREDLYYRLNVIPLNIPPLRQRREDIPPLALSLLEKFNRGMGLNKRLAPEVLDLLMRYDFPGNVRELINLMERLMIMSDGEVIGIADLPGELRRPAVPLADPLEQGVGLKAAVQAYERRMIEGALRRHGSLAGAAQALKVHPTTLWRKLARLGQAPSMQ